MTVDLDPKKVEIALDRIKELKESIEHFNNQASAANGRIAILIRTWQLCPHPGQKFCCNDPLDCQGPQQ